MILSVLLSVLLVSPAVVKAQLCYGNQLPCVSGASCVTDECQCNSGFAGNGRTYCAQSRCVCSTIADPHVFLFDANQQVTTSLPCSLFLTNFVDGKCKVQGYIDTETRGTGNATNFRVFTNRIRASISNFGLRQVNKVTVGASGVVSTGSPGTITSGESDGFTYAESAGCNTRIGYNATYGSAYISLPSSGSTYTQFCGNCNGATDENPGATPASQLAYTLKYLADTSQQRGTYGTQCGAIQSTLLTCSTANRVIAASICINYINSFGKCLLDNNNVATYSALITRFYTCVSNVCSDKTATACTNLTSLDTASANCALSPRPTACP